VIVPICTVPVINVRNVVGATVAAEAKVTGWGCKLLWTVAKF